MKSNKKQMWMAVALSATLMAPLSIGQVGEAAQQDLDGQGSASTGGLGGCTVYPYSPIVGSLAPFFGKKAAQSATAGDASLGGRDDSSNSGSQALTLGSGDLTLSRVDDGADEPAWEPIKAGLLDSFGKVVSKIATAGDASLGGRDDSSNSGSQALTLGSGDLTLSRVDDGADEPAWEPIKAGLLDSFGKVVSKSAKKGDASLGPREGGAGSPNGGTDYTLFGGGKSQARASASDLELQDVPWEPEALTAGSGELAPFDGGADNAPYSPAKAHLFDGDKAPARASNGDIDVDVYDGNSGSGGIHASQQGTIQGTKSQVDLAGAIDLDEIRRKLRGLTPITVINSTAGSAQLNGFEPAQGGPLSDAEATLDAEATPPLQQAVMPGQLLSKCGITVYNHPDSSGPVNVGDLDDACFEDIEINSGRRVTVTIDDDAQGLEYLQVRVRGLAQLTVEGDRGLGSYDPRDLEGSKVGIVIEGAGSVSHPGMERGSVTLRSPGNVVHSLGSSHSHQIDVWSTGNLVKMSGEDAVQVFAPGGDADLANMVISLHPEFGY